MSRLPALATALLLSLGAALPGQAVAGKIVLANDEWTLSNAGQALAAPNDPAVFATNVASWFTGGGPGNFLAYSNNFGLTGSSLANTMTSAGNTWTVSTAVSFNLATLQTYDGVFLGGTFAPGAAGLTVLSQYVQGGGNVYLMGGTGSIPGGAAGEANQWNPFLNQFGLAFSAGPYNGVSGNIAISSLHPIFTNVDHLYQDNGSDTLDITLLESKSQVLVSLSGHGLYAVYDSDAPEPGTLALLGAGLLLAPIARRRRSTLA